MQQSNSTKIIAGIIGLVIIVGGIGAFVASNNADEVVDTTTKTSEVMKKEESKPEATKPAPTADVVGLAIATPDLSTLVAAVKAAELVTTLQGKGPFTVFAPTNSAFAALPAGTLDTLLLPENKAKLAGILTYHVVSGKVLSKDLKNGQVVKTVQGENLTVNIMDGKVTLTDANGGVSTISAVDIEASNGVVHVISSVVLPKN